MTGNRDLYTITTDGTDSIISDKEIIKKRLYQDVDIISVLNNTDLQGHPPDEYLDVNIFSHLYNPYIEHQVKNMIFFDVENYDSVDYNPVYIQKIVTMMILVDNGDLKTVYGCERHDMLGYLIRDLFNWSNCLGTQIQLVVNKIEPLNNSYSCRVLQFQSITPNGLSSARIGGTNNRIIGRNNAYD